MNPIERFDVGGREVARDRFGLFELAVAVVGEFCGAIDDRPEAIGAH